MRSRIVLTLPVLISSALCVGPAVAASGGRREGARGAPGSIENGPACGAATARCSVNLSDGDVPAVGIIHIDRRRAEGPSRLDDARLRDAPRVAGARKRMFMSVVASFARGPHRVRIDQ